MRALGGNRRYLLPQGLPGAKHAHADSGGCNAAVARDFLRRIPLKTLLQERTIAARAPVKQTAKLDRIQVDSVGHVLPLLKGHGQRTTETRAK